MKTLKGRGRPRGRLMNCVMICLAGEWTTIISQVDYDINLIFYQSFYINFSSAKFSIDFLQIFLFIISYQSFSSNYFLLKVFYQLFSINSSIKEPAYLIQIYKSEYIFLFDEIVIQAAEHYGRFMSIAHCGFDSGKNQFTERTFLNSYLS